MNKKSLLARVAVIALVLVGVAAASGPRVMSRSELGVRSGCPFYSVVIQYPNQLCPEDCSGYPNHYLFLQGFYEGAGKWDVRDDPATRVCGHHVGDLSPCPTDMEQFECE